MTEQRRPLVAANWKMHKTIGETEDFLDRFVGELGELGAVDVVVCPPVPRPAGGGRAHPPLADRHRGSERP